MFRQFSRFGRAQTQLYRDFRRAGMPRSSSTAFVRDTLWLVAHVGDVRSSPAARGRWVRVAAKRWGRLIGTVRHRVVDL